MAVTLKTSEVNHLRRLLGWVRCNVGQAPEEQLETYRMIADKLNCHMLDEAAQQRVLESFIKADSVPKYIRDAVNMLEPLVREANGNIVDAEIEKNRLPPIMLDAPPQV